MRHARAAGVNLSESISLTDETSRAAGVNLSESVSFDRFDMQGSAGVNLTESVSLTDETSRIRWCESIRINIVDR